MRSFRIALVLLLLAGCATPASMDGVGAAASSSATATSGAEAVSEPKIQAVAAEAENVTEPSTNFTIRAEGPAGSWIVVHVPYTSSTDSVSFDYSYEAQVEGAEDGKGAFFWPLGGTQPHDGNWSIGAANPFLNRLVTFQAGEQSWSRQGRQSSSSSQGIEGLFFALGAEHPWSLQVTVESETLFLQPQVVRGSGIQFSRGGEGTLPISGNGPVNQFAFEAAVPDSGWSHMEVVRYRLQPDGVSQVQLELPNGHSAQQLGVQQGYYAAAGSAGGGHLDYIGSVADIAGTAKAELTYARVDTESFVAYVHLPLRMADLPGLVDVGYSGSTWPFDEPHLPPV